MAGAAPVAAAWAPGYAWGRETTEFQTRLNFVPRVFARDEEERFAGEIHLYTGHAIASKKFALPEHSCAKELRLPLRDVLDNVGLDSFDGLLEIHAHSTTKVPEPNLAKFLEVWVDVASRDGKFYISYPAVPNRGQFFKVFTGQYQVWPGILMKGATTSDVVLINANRKPVPAKFALFNSDGECAEGPEFEAPFRSVVQHRLEEEIPGARALLEKTGGIGSLRVWFKFKLNAYVMFRNRETGTVSSFDHLSPYFRR
jgi:hypothetical protein